MKRLCMLVGLLLTAAACSQDEDEAHTAPAPVTEDKGGGGAPSTGAPSSGAPATPAPGTAPPSEGATGGGDKPAEKPAEILKTGNITLTQTNMKVGTTSIISYAVSAGFVDATGAVVPESAMKCTQSKEGDCDVTTCDVPKPSGTNPPAPGPSGETKPLPSAGEISIDALEDVKITPDDKGLYAPATGSVALFKVNQSIAVKAEGADVPAFDKTITAPSLITVSSPTWPAAPDKLAVDRAKDLTLKWTNGTAGDVQATVSTVTTDKIATVTCHFKADAGTGTLPKAALGHLVVSDTASISVSVTATETFEEGGWKVNLTALRPAKTSSGLASGLVTIK